MTPTSPPTWRRVLDLALDLLIPALCPCCRGSAGAGLCPACREGLRSIADPCPWCAAPHGDGGLCPTCQDVGLPGIARLHVRWHYLDRLADLVTAAKARGRPAAVRAATDLLADDPDLADLAADAVTVIPETPSRRSGPHLGTALARRLARRNGLPFRHLLGQTRRPRAQHALSQAERQHNVADLFRAAESPPRVILVDDLVTSGATLAAAARALRSAGARTVTAVCLARTPKGEDLIALQREAS